MGAGLAWGNTGTSEPISVRTNCCAWGGLPSGTNELIGEDLNVVIRLDANQ